MFLEKKDPFVRGLEKKRLTLNLLKEDTFSTVGNLALFLQISRDNAYRTFKRLEKQGLVVLDERPWRFAQRGKCSIWGLTLKGSRAIVGFESQRYYSAKKVSDTVIEHSLETQRAKIFALRAGWTWVSSRDVYQKAYKEPFKWLQVPDAIATSPKGEVIAIEVERSEKSLSRYKAIANNYCQMFYDKTVQHVVYICDAEIKESIERKIFSSEKIEINKKLNNFNETFKRKFHFVTYEEWEIYVKNL